MAKLYFYYAAMNAGKSTVLLQASYNYQERGMRTLLFAPAIDTRAGANSFPRPGVSRRNCASITFRWRPWPSAA